MTQRRLPLTRRGYLCATAASAIGGCVGKGSTQKLTMGIVPDVDPDTAIQKNTALSSYVEEEIGATMKLRTSTDYAGMVRAMAADQVDIAYFGGVSYILAHNRANARPLVVGAKDGSTQWHSTFITHSSTDIDSMDDVENSASDLDLVFGDPISTSGTVMPTYYLQTRYDLTPKRDFASVTHVGAHDATARTIASGDGDLGALNSRIYDALVADGTIGKDVVEVWRTPGFPDYPWAVSTKKDGQTF
jgi:phosphonate transport system substrate-binding protein